MEAIHKLNAPDIQCRLIHGSKTKTKVCNISTFRCHFVFTTLVILYLPSFTLFLVNCAGDLKIMAIFFTISILTLLWYTWLLIKRRRHPLPPGPQGLPVVGYLPFLQPQLHSHFADLARKYGPIFSLKLGGKTSVVISSPAVVRAVLKENDVTFANRDVPVVVTAMEYGGHDIVFTPYGAEWRMLRKVCVRDMLGNATLDAFYSYRRKEVRNSIKYLYGLKGDPVNVGELMFSSVLNVITSMLWGGTIQVCLIIRLVIPFTRQTNTFQ